MNADLHRQVKELFAELCDLPPTEQQKRVDQLMASSPVVAKELKSLLQYHTNQSIVIEAPQPKIRTRSTLSRTFRSRPRLWVQLLLRSLLYAIPLVLAGILLSYWTNHRIQNLLYGSVANQLEDLIDQRVQQFRQWEASQTEAAVAWASDETIQIKVRELLSLADEVRADNTRKLGEELLASPCASAISKRLQHLAGVEVKFALWDRQMITIADWNQERVPKLIGASVTPAGASMLTEAFKGRPRVYLPGLADAITEGFELESGATNLFILVPLVDDTGNVTAVLMLRGFGAEESFQNLFEKWTKLQSSETYLVNERGVLLSPSRYADALKQLELAETTIDAKKTYLVRDPGVNLMAGEKSDYNALAWPLTLSARQVTAGNGGLSTARYRNYVGMEVVGAWRWLPDRKAGIVVEEHADDAYAIANTAKRAILGLTALFGLVMALVGVFTTRRFAGALQRDISDVGPYQMQELLGEGGMGRVYLAEHALLCRQSAVKLLSGDGIDLNVISRFEREVQLASQLTHPNTIAIYDFGRDRDGRFYYAMEYIHGAHLGQLVEYSGAVHPGRCIYLLRQLCRALSEAHQAGVVHRDIKPQNIMVCNRGGEPDFVKLFDYGLVKAFAPGVSHGTTSQTKVVVGTPRFMAPERLNSPWLADPRVDIYSVGAVAYYLLTGKLPPLFTLSGPTSNEQPGIETLDLPVGAVEFGDLLGMCMSPEPSDRPSSMQGLLRDLEELAEKFPWSREDSAVWWQNHEAKLLKLVKSKRQSLVTTKS